MLVGLIIILSASCCSYCVLGSSGHNYESYKSVCGCQNGGVCIKFRWWFSICLCKSGYTGAKCENAIDPCYSNPCGYHGVCTKSGSCFQCSCEKGYGGVPCQLATSEPTGNTCNNSLDCTVSVKGSICEDGLCYCPYNYRYVDDSTPTSTNLRNAKLCLHDCPENYELTNDISDFLPLPSLKVLLNDNDKIFTGLSLDECKQRCVDEVHGDFQCRTIEWFPFLTCHLHILTASDYEVRIFDDTSTASAQSYERPCIKKAVYK